MPYRRPRTKLAGASTVWLMPQSVSVPEKTLEHWSSQYITYRYRSNAALWWPTSGEDINVRSLPAMPGKAVQLELKTTTPASSRFHNAFVDLGQLWEYRQRPPGRQPFYAFPRPDWAGNLKAFAIAQGHAVTELAFARSGPNWWFADWMVVMTAKQVADVLQPELTAHGSKRRKAKERLVQFDSKDPKNPMKTKWGPIHSSRPAPSPGPINWRDFWSVLERCGPVEIEWPQLIRLPARMAQAQGPYPRQRVVGMLQEAAVLASEEDNNEPLVTLEPNADGTIRSHRTPLMTSADQMKIGLTKTRLTRSTTIGRSSF